MSYATGHHLILIFAPQLLSNALFNIVVMEMMSYLPFFILGAYAFKFTCLKAIFLRRSRWVLLVSLLLFVAYMLNQHLYGPQQLDVMIKALLGVMMTHLVFSFGHSLLNYRSPRISYLVNAPLFIYLVHHPLTIIYGAFVTPGIGNNLLGFLLGLLFVFSLSLVLYGLHKRIPILRFLFSGKRQ